MLKGSDKADQLDRIAVNWEMDHQKHTASTATANHIAQSSGVVDSPKSDRTKAKSADAYGGTVIVGLGNPAKKYNDTPHNVGQKVLDLMVESLGLTWSSSDYGTIARAEIEHREVILLKPVVEVNDTGPLLAKMAISLGFGPENVIIVQDDIHLDLGIVRPRNKGSAGGHNGVQSILVAFQSEKFRRIKIGVGRPVTDQSIGSFVLTPFGNSQKVVIDNACQETIACLRVLIEQQ